MIELRRVPPDWSHPRDFRGAYIPMHGTSFKDALRRWKKNRPTDEAMPVCGKGAALIRGSYVPYTRAEATYFQVYEDVSEGTPLSPVFASRKAVVKWLLWLGHRVEDAEAFVKLGAVPSLTKVGDCRFEGIRGAEAILKQRRARPCTT